MDNAFVKDTSSEGVADAAVAAFNVATQVSSNGQKSSSMEDQHLQQLQQQQVQQQQQANDANYFARKHDDELIRSPSPANTSLNDRRYTCETCKQSFTRKHNLKSHILIHTSDKPFKCTECGLTFRRGYDLKRHVKTHTKEKPFQCKQCGKGFARTDALLRHTNSSSGCGNDLLDEDHKNNLNEPTLKKVKLNDEVNDSVVAVATAASASDTVPTPVDDSIIDQDLGNVASAATNISTSLRNSYDNLNSILLAIEQSGADTRTLGAMMKLSDLLMSLENRVKSLNERVDKLANQ